MIKELKLNKMEVLEKICGINWNTCNDDCNYNLYIHEDGDICIKYGNTYPMYYRYSLGSVSNIVIGWTEIIEQKAAKVYKKHIDSFYNYLLNLIVVV